MSYRFSSKIWEFYGKKGVWYFVTVPADQATEIRMLTSKIKRGFNSVKVKATIGSSTWKTSIFVYSKDGSYVLPIKKSIRDKEQLHTGDQPQVNITLMDL